jgi:hypothetical protein
VKILEIHNRCLLSKWLFNLINSDGTWQQLLKNKYLGDKSITQVGRKSGHSHFWSGLINIKDQFLCLGSFTLQDEKQIRFWEDKWLGANMLRDEYPNLYNIVRRKTATVADIFRTRPLNITFRRSLVATNLDSWNHLVLRLAHIHLRERADIFRWSLNYNGQFSISSMY